VRYLLVGFHPACSSYQRDGVWLDGNIFRLGETVPVQLGNYFSDFFGQVHADYFVHRSVFCGDCFRI